MPDWREHAARGDWQEINLAHVPEEDHRELFEALSKVVPKRLRTDHLESVEEFALQSEIADRRLKDAAVLLADLEGTFDDEPTWLDVAIDYAREVLRELDASPSHVNGSPRSPDEAKYLSREWHALKVLDISRHMSTMRSWAAYSIKDPGPVSEEWLHSWMDEAAAAAYSIGRHLQSAWGKQFDPATEKGLKMPMDGKHGGDARGIALEPRRRKILHRMEVEIDKGTSVREAAKRAYDCGLGKSTEANRKLWNRNKLGH